MIKLLLCLIVLGHVYAQPLPVIPMQMDPDQLARSLRDRKPLMPEADCKALDLWECHPDTPSRTTDISLRWVQLDDDAELEAILITEAKTENTYAAYVFDKHASWNLVGSFFCQQWTCDQNSLIRVQKLTEDSPPLLLCYRDLGGAGTVSLTTEAFHLRGGKLWPAFEFKNYEETNMVPSYRESKRFLASRDRLVVHTIREEPPGERARNSCEVWRWETKKYTFIRVPEDRANYCDVKSGKPILGKSFPTGLAIHP